MRILILYGGDSVYKSLALRLYEKLNSSFNVEVWNETISLSPFSILKFRIKKFGLLRGFSQFIYKVYDYYFLRSKLKKRVEDSESSRIKNYSIIQCGNINDKLSHQNHRLAEFDLVVGIATSIIKRKTLLIPKHGFINIHPGILPQYRGIGNFWALYNRDFKNVGATVHWMTPEIDVGTILCKEYIDMNKKTLWQINYDSMSRAIDKLANIFNKGLIFDTVEAPNGVEKYYSWNGIVEYISYLISKRKY